MSLAPEPRVAEFGGLRIGYDDRLLTPRPWTVAQSTWAAELLAAGAPDGPVLELCTGAGHIGLEVVRLTGRRLVAVDRSQPACDWARRNAADAGLDDLVEVRCGDLDEAVAPEERFALVVADPPWVPSAEVTRFPDDPLTAIDGGLEGLDLAHRCVAVAARCLSPGGALVLQLGDDDQADAVTAAAAGHGLAEGGRRGFERGTLLLLTA